MLKWNSEGARHRLIPSQYMLLAMVKLKTGLMRSPTSSLLWLNEQSRGSARGECPFIIYLVSAFSKEFAGLVSEQVHDLL